MRRNRNTAAVGMYEQAVASTLTSEEKTIGKERGDKAAGGDRAETRVVDHPTVTAIIG
jgi:septal ring-binding cell division protein DamX